MADLGFLLVCTFGNYSARILVAAPTANNLALSDDEQGLDCLAVQHEQNEGYESD